MSDAIGDAITANDLDALIRLVDTFAGGREWDQLVNLAERARRAAFDTGRQMWPAANHAEYRLALDAPAEYAGTVLHEDAGRFAIGPLSEVAAQAHTWAELAPHAPPGPVAALAAHERVVRGEPVDPATVTFAEVLNVPLALAPWEPEYLVPTYRPERVDQPGPEPIRGRALAVADRTPKQEPDPAVEHAIRDLVRPWTAHSEGSARVASVRGDAADAIAALGMHDVRGAWVDAGEALTCLGWAGATGGRHGRRRGAAAGRDLAWAAAGALAGFEPGERLDPEALGDAIAELRWFVWSAPDISTGWVLRLAIEDPVDGIAWALDAVDRGEEVFAASDDL
jgi:hypothetical protein